MQTILYITNNPENFGEVSTFLNTGNTFKLIHITKLSELTTVTIQSSDAMLIEPDKTILHYMQTYYPEMPLIIINDKDDESCVSSMIKMGAQDHLIKKNINPHTLMHAIDCAILRHQIRMKLVKLANHDVLTGLPNRQLLQDRLQQTLAYCQRYQQQFALLMLDINNFKLINDKYGHQYGDTLLKTIATRLQTCIRNVDTVARLGGDEFVVLLTHIADVNSATIVAERLLVALATPFQLGSDDILINVSVGIAVYPKDGNNAELLLHQADLAMYRAKKANVGYCVADLVEKITSA